MSSNDQLPSTSKSPQNPVVPENIQNAPPLLPLSQANLDRIQATKDQINRLRGMYLHISEDDEEFMANH